MKLGSYEILSALGAGGMGEVYRARDGKLGRDVAIKILPPIFTADPERLARFEREARVLASLNHPHIAAIYGLEDAGGVRALVLELVEGETLAEKLGPSSAAAHGLVVAESLAIARQIASALDAAHERGIVHRDLKPANIKITADGVVKVLDFGLAKVADAAASGLTHSPTMIGPTGEGMLLGTAPYMSPEQARGKAVDKRTDIWAFGCVLYEMLTGRRAFPGETSSDAIAAILGREPDWSALPPATPSTVRRLLQRCLQKDARDRLRDIGDAIAELNESRTDSGVSGGSLDRAAATPLRSSVSPLAAAALALAVAVASGAAAWFVARRSIAQPSQPLKRFLIDTRATPLNEALLPIVVSPDGTKLAYTAGSYEGSQIYLRALDQRDVKPLAGTTSAFNPFFSPDGRWIGFSASSGLKKVPVTGGPVVSLFSTNRRITASWGPDDTIVYSVGETGGLWKIVANGGTPQALTTPDAAQGEIAHSWPDVLPNGTAVLFSVRTGTATDAYRVAVQSFDSKAHRTLVEGGTFPRYIPTGHIVYAQSGTLFAAPFDVDRLAITGPGVPMLDGVSMDSGAGNAQFSVSREGTLAYVEAIPADQRSLVWVDRHGSASSFGAPQRAFVHTSLSPDGKRLAVEVRDGPRIDVWLYEIATAIFTRLTFDGSSAFPVWSRDSKTVASAFYGAPVNAVSALHLQAIDTNQPVETLVTNTKGGVWPGSWTPDGQTLAIMWSEPPTGGDIDVMDMRGPREPKPFINTAATEWGAKLSPDGKWMAFISNESGRWEVYVQPYPGPGTKRQITTGGGTEIVWAHSGREIFYRNGRQLMSVAIDTTPTFAAHTPKVLFEGPYLLGSPGAHRYDVSVDDQQFVMVQPGEQEESRPLEVILNWFDEVKRRVPAR